MLEQQGIYNDLSPKLREELEKRINDFGKSVRFKFNIEKPNPDPLKYNGALIYPFTYTLDPKVFQITDPYETREGKQKVKTIGIINKLKEDGKTAESFKCVRINERFKGVLYYDLEDIDQREFTALLLLHPKLVDGKFKDKNKIPVFSIINETKLATEQRTLRSAKLIALNYAEKMSDQDVVDFADAMGGDNSWDSTQDPSILRNKIEELAENTPAAFNELVKDEKMKFQTVVKQAFDNNIISYDPTANQIVWVSTTQAIAVLGTNMDKNEVVRAAEFFQLGGDKATKAFEKIKSLLKK